MIPDSTPTAPHPPRRRRARRRPKKVTATVSIATAPVRRLLAVVAVAVAVAVAAAYCPGGPVPRRRPRRVGPRPERLVRRSTVLFVGSAQRDDHERRKEARSPVNDDDDDDDGQDAAPRRPRPSRKHYDPTIRSSRGVAGASSGVGGVSASTSTTAAAGPAAGYRPTPAMPSQLFQQLAQSQLELLAASLKVVDNGSNRNRNSKGSTSKIKSMALYLPQENAMTGQLEFLPAVLHPHPDKDRVFIAPGAASGLAPALPRTLTKLPGFAVAASLLPGYPMVSASSTDAGVGVVEEVFCNVRGGQVGSGGGGGGAALSVPLFSGSQTVGVLLVSPSDDLVSQSVGGSVWTNDDREQVARAAKSLSLALSMDTERLALQTQNRAVKEALSDSLHQLKNPLQALRTYGKLLQQRIADSESISSPATSTQSSSMLASTNSSVPTTSTRRSATPQLLELADHLLVQSDRLSQRLKPVDWIVDRMDDPPPRPPLRLLRPAEERSLVRWTDPSASSATTDSSSVPRESSSSALVPSGRLVPPQQSTTRQVVRGDSIVPSAGPVAANDVDEVWDAQDRPRSPLLDSHEDTMEIGFLEDVLEPVVSAFRAIAADRSIDFAVEVADDVPGVTVSAPATQEVVSNLLDNAFKYVVGLVNTDEEVRGDALGRARRKQPRVRLSITSNPPGVPPGATLFVEDNGPGIPEAERDAIFTRGYRGSQSSSEIQGSGLGLGIARALVQKMGGSIRALTPRQAKERGCRLTGAVLEVVLYRNPDKAGPL